MDSCARQGPPYGRRPISATDRTTDGDTAPALADLARAAREAEALFERVSAVRGAWVNGHGGDVGSSGSRRSLVRHAANYLAAASLAGTAPGDAQVVDVGGGVGAFSTWLGQRVGAPATLVDHDPRVLGVAGVAFPELRLERSLDALPDASAWLVTAMEVIEHVPPAEQESFVRQLARVVAPGGLLVLSTPDESRYVGGWSGYAPHVGVLDAPALGDLLGRATGRPVEVWRMEGASFEVNGVERVLLPMANRLVTVLRESVPAVLDRIGHAATRIGAALPTRSVPDDDRAEAVPAHLGAGSGLVAAVRFG